MTDNEEYSNEFLINQMVEDMDQLSFERMKEAMTEYDDVDGMPPDDFIELWNRLIDDPVKENDPNYQQKIVDMFAQIDFDQDGRVSWMELSSNLVSAQRVLSSAFPTYDDTPHVVHNPLIFPDRLLYMKGFNKLVSCGKPGSNAIWSVRDSALYRMIDEHKASMHHAIYVDSKKLLLTCGADRKMFAIDTQTLKTKKTLSTITSQLCMVYDDNADVLYSGSSDATINIFDLEKWAQVGTFKKVNHHTDFIMDLIMLEDLNILFSCSLDRTIKLWDTRSLSCKGTKKGHEKGVVGMSYSKEYKILATWGCEKYCYLWNTLGSKSIFRIEGHSKPLIGAEIVEGTPELITADNSGTVIVWDIRNLKPIQKLRPQTFDTTKYASFCYDRYYDQVITCGENEMNFWRAIQSEGTQGKINHPVAMIRYNRVFKQILTGSKRFLTIWKSSNGNFHKQYPISDSDITEILILGQYRHAAIATFDGELKRVSLMDGTVSKTVFIKDELRGIYSVEKELADEEKSHLLVPTLKGDVHRIDLSKEKIVSTVHSQIKNCSISFSAYSDKFKLLATVCGEQIEVWKPFSPDSDSELIPTEEDLVGCLFVDEWNCFISYDISGYVKFFCMPKFRHLLTIQVSHSDSKTDSESSNLSSILSVLAHEDERVLFICTKTHVSVIHIDYLIDQCKIEINRKKVRSQGKVIKFRNRFFVSQLSMDLNSAPVTGFDNLTDKLICLQFIDQKRFDRLKRVHEEIPEHQYIIRNFGIYPPEVDEKTNQLGCSVTEHHTVTLRKYFEYQELEIDEIRTILLNVVLAIVSLHKAGFVFNLLSMDSIVRVNSEWVLSNFNCCVKVGDIVDLDDLPVRQISPEYAKRISTNQPIIAQFSQDIWSIGVLLLKLLTKRELFEPSVTIMQLISEFKGGNLDVHAHEIVDVSLRSILLRTLLLDPAFRWKISKIHQELSISFVNRGETSQNEISVDSVFPLVLHNEPYDPFLLKHNDKHILVSETLITKKNEISAAELILNPPILLLSLYNKTKDFGWIEMRKADGSKIGTTPPPTADRPEWKYPQAVDFESFSIHFAPPPVDESCHESNLRRWESSSRLLLQQKKEKERKKLKTRENPETYSPQKSVIPRYRVSWKGRMKLEKESFD